jgi:protein-tyrosine phosphatase
MSKVVLFLCTGNYYRSRFAEIYFNFVAQREALPWRAVSRGLQVGRHGNKGPVSEYTQKRLGDLKIVCPTMEQMPNQCRPRDLEAASMVIALKEAEHRAMLASDFAGWEDRVTYWHVHDLDAATPDTALREIESLVENLVAELKAR